MDGRPRSARTSCVLMVARAPVLAPPRPRRRRCVGMLSGRAAPRRGVAVVVASGVSHRVCGHEPTGRLFTRSARATRKRSIDAAFRAPPQGASDTFCPGYLHEFSARRRGVLATARRRLSVRKLGVNARARYGDPMHAPPARSLITIVLAACASFAPLSSARAQHRICRVARTIADLAGAERIGVAHLAEAIGYRRMET